MLKKRAIRKILITSITTFILLVVYLIPTTEQEKSLNTNLEVEYIAGMGTNNIYLINRDGYLVKTKILVDEEKIEDKVKKVINNLIKNNNSKSPNGLEPLIPINTKLLNVSVDNDLVTLDFSKEILNVSDRYAEKMLESIIFSLTELDKIKKINILVNGEKLTKIPNMSKELPEVLTRDFGINKVYDIENRNGINKVVLYYVNNTFGDDYYVPVTKYVNDSRDKIKIIVDNLTSNYIYETNLMSYISQNTKLLNYEIIDDIMVLNFNEYIFSNDNSILEEVIYTISSSVFDNYDVKQVLFRVNDQEIVKKSIKDIE